MPDNPYQMDWWDSFEGDLWDDLAAVLLDAYFAGIDGGINALPPALRVLVDFDRVNTDALEWAKGYRYSLIKGITDTTREQTQKAISDWIASGAPLDALEAALERTFGAVRAKMIAQTESTRVFAQGNRAAFESTGLVEEVRWNTARDDLVCPICGPKDGKVYAVGSEGEMPPAHVNCRCWVSPVVSEDKLADKLDEILV